MKRNLLIKIVISILLTNILAACAVFQAAPIVKTPIRVEFTQWWGDYTLLVAKEKGYFEEYGIEVEPVYYKDYPDSQPDLAAGQIDGGLVSIGDAININRTSPIKAVAIYDNGGEDAVVAGSEINSIQDLKGKTLGLQPGTQYELTSAEMLRSANMTLDDLNVITVNPEDAVAALKNNQVQAAYTWEPYLSDALANGYKIIYPQEQLYLFPDLIVFRESFIDERPEDVRAFLKAWFKALEYRQQHQSETRIIAAKYLGISAEEVQPDDGLSLLTITENKTLFDVQEENSIYSITNITSNYLASIGATIQKVDPLELFDPSFLP